MTREPRATGDGEPRVSAEALAAIEIDPDVFLEVIADLAESAARRRKRFDPIASALRTYCDFYGIDAHGEIEPEPVLEMAALASRVGAFFDVIEQVVAAPAPERLPALAIAACTARLIEKDGRPAFQLLDFVAALGRAEAADRT